jgi:outer membrane protein TolC
MSQRVFSRAALTLVSLLLVITARAQSDNVAGTMPEDYLPQLKPILTNALRSPDLVAREFERLLQEVRVDEARAQRLPQVGGNFNYGLTQSATKSNNSHQDRSTGFYYGFGANQALFHWRALKNQQDAARLALLATEKNYAQYYRAISTTIRKAYLALIVEKANLRQRRASVELVRRDVDIAEAKFSSGTISAGLREGERLRLRENEFDLRRAEAEFETNRRRFARLAVMGELPEDAVPDELPRPNHSEPRTTLMMATVLKENARGTLEFEYWDLRVREAELGQKIAATRLLPKFGAAANYSLRNNVTVNGNTINQEAVTEQSIGLSGSWAIFDGFATRAAKQQALLNKRSLEHQKTMRIEELLESAQTLARKLKFDAEQLEFVATRKGIAEDSQSLAAEQAKLGNVAGNVVDQARIAVMFADAKNFEARAAYLGDWCDFVGVAGDDPVLNNLPARYARAKK